MPKIPVRQWVLTVPHDLRFRMAFDPKVARLVLRTFVSIVSAWLRKKVRAMGIQGTLKTGGVTVIQRFGSAINLNVHFHSAMIDGVYRVPLDRSPVFHPVPAPTDEEVAVIVAAVCRKVTRKLARHDGEMGSDSLAAREPLLAALANASVGGRIATGPRRGAKVLRVGGQAVEATIVSKRCALVDGFNLHANVRIAANDRQGLEHLARYLARPPIAADRLTQLDDGRLALRMKRAFSDGTESITIMLSVKCRPLHPLIDRPRGNLVPMPRGSRHGVLLVRAISAAFGLATVHGACGGAPQRLPVDVAENGPPPTGDAGVVDLPPGADGPPATDTPGSADGSPVPDAAPASDGVVEGGPSADAMLPSAGGGTWQRLAALPSVRQEHGVAAVNGQIFVVGGLGAGAARVDAYDPQTNTWMPHANLPMGVDHPNVAGVGDKLYLLGGTQTGNVFEYNPFAAAADRRWTMKSALPVARAAGAVGVIGDKVLLAGGRGGGVTAGVDLQIYDPATDTWQASSRGEVPPLPVGRNHLAGAAVDGLFFVIGGRSVSSTSTLYNRVDVYDPVAKSWSERAPMPTRRGGVAAGVAAGLIIAVGGEGNDRVLNVNGIFPQAEAFSPRANVWVSLALMMTPRHGMGVAGIGDKLYVPGGGTVQDVGGASAVLDVLSPY